MPPLSGRKPENARLYFHWIPKGLRDRMILKNFRAARDHALAIVPTEAIAAATINAAHAIRRADTVGSIEAGKQADLLVLSVPDYRHLGYRFGANLVHTVIKRGQVYPIQSTP